MKSTLVSLGLIVVCLCVVYGVGVTPGNYQIPTLDSTCTVVDTQTGGATSQYVNSNDRAGVFTGEPDGLTSGIEVTTTSQSNSKNTFINFNTNPMGFGTMDQTFSATYTYYITSRPAGAVYAPALQIFLDTPQPSGGLTDKTFIYEPYNDGDSSKYSVNTWHRLTITYTSGQIWMRDTSSTRENCHWNQGGTTCDPGLGPYLQECYNSATTPTSGQCSAPFGGGPNLPTISEFLNPNSVYPVGKVYGNTLAGARILGIGINLGSGNPDITTIVTKMALTTDVGTYSFTFPKVASAMTIPCPAGPCDAPTPFNVSITPERSSLYNGSTLARGTDLSVELRLAFNSTASQQSSNTIFKYQCLIDYRGDRLRYLGSNGACHSVDFANLNVGEGSGSSVLCNFETPSARFGSFNSTTGYAGNFRSTLRFNNFAGNNGTSVPLNASCTPLNLDSNCPGNTAVIRASTEVLLSNANMCSGSTGVSTGTGNDCSGPCPGDFTLERESDVKLRVTDQGDVFMCPDPRSGGQLINVCNLLNTLQG